MSRNHFPFSIFNFHLLFDFLFLRLFNARFIIVGKESFYRARGEISVLPFFHFDNSSRHFDSINGEIFPLFFRGDFSSQKFGENFGLGADCLS